MTTDAQQTKDQWAPLALPRLLDELRDYDTVMPYRHWDGVCRQAANQIEELERDVARWVNAHRVVMIERDHFKQIAEINLQTVKDMQVCKHLTPYYGQGFIECHECGKDLS